MNNRNFVIFMLVSFVIALPLFYYSTQITSPLTITLLFLLGSYAPALGAWLAVSTADEAEKQSFRGSLRGWSSGRWLWVAILAPSFCWLAAYGVTLVTVEARKPVWFMLATLPVILLVNYGEEIGWRGYALPFLMKRMDAGAASLLLGIIWAFFHIPLYLQRPLFGIIAFVAILLISIILSWMFVNTGKILPGIIFHAVFDAWTQVFAGGPNAEWILFIVTVLLAIYVMYIFAQHGKDLKPIS